MGLLFPLNRYYLSTFRFRRKYMLIDACEAEEKVMEGLFAVGMNQHKELSTLTMLGEICLSRDKVCVSMV